MRVLGMISGTSHDGIDVAVVTFRERGDHLDARIEQTSSTPYPAQLRAELLAALPPAPVGFEEACRLDTLLGQTFAAAAEAALTAYAAHPDSGPVDLICSHGQTVFHWVRDREALGTLQLGQPAWIAEATGLPVVSDVRAADIAAGGQGAPLVPVLDVQLLARYVDQGRRAAALNLGGISNVTVCAPDSDPVAWDIGPANALLDAVITDATQGASSYDESGRLAAQGSIDATLLDTLLTEPYYSLDAPKSTGKELFHLAYIQDALRGLGHRTSLPDLAATLTELTAVTVADAVRRAGVEVVVAAGGGVRNPTLMRRLDAHLPGVEITTTDALGVPAGEKEAVAFALIGWATANQLPGNVPSCTGARDPRVLGRITPGPTGAFPAERRHGWPSRLVFTSEQATPRT